MPIYEYRCASCGFQKEYLQRVSEPPLTECPSCGANAFKKMVTAAGFQLKGTGWYATDFKNGSKRPAPSTEAKSADSSGEAKPSTTESAKTEKSETSSGSSSAPAPSPATSGSGASSPAQSS